MWWVADQSGQASGFAFWWLRDLRPQLIRWDMRTASKAYLTAGGKSDRARLCPLLADDHVRCGRNRGCLTLGKKGWGREGPSCSV